MSHRHKILDNTAGRRNMQGMPATSAACLPAASMPPPADASMKPDCISHSVAGNGIRLSSDPSVPCNLSMVMLLFCLLNIFPVHSLGKLSLCQS